MAVQNTQTPRARFVAGFLRVGAALMLVIGLLLAQSDAGFAQNVRPPGNAVNLDDANDPGPLNTLGTESDSEIWDEFRGGKPREPEAFFGPRPEGANMTTTGQQWRYLRENYIRKYAGWFPLGVIALLAVYHLIKGPMRIKGGRSGKTLPRFNLTQRVAHWFMASVFTVLAITGLIILLGRSLIAPYLGKGVNSVLTSAAMQAHNLFGPLFILALVWMFIKYVRGNFFQWVDLKWIFKLGGFFGGHVSSSQFNFGEKSWFWMVVLVGAVISATGILLLFPWLVEDIRWLQLSTILHAVGAIALISVLFGHIYVGTIGMEGSLDSMLKGEVDENWAKEHHDLWYEDVTGTPARPTSEDKT